MRGICAFIGLACLAVSLGAWGEEVAQPVPADGACPVPADESWTKQEKFVWGRVCVGKAANFNSGTAYGGELDPKKPEEWPESRVLTSAFLETILLKDKYRHQLTRVGVRIIGARFTETVDLTNAQLGHELWLDKGRLEQGADFSGLSSTQDISIDGAKVAGTLDLSVARLGKNLYMRQAELADVVMRSARVDGQITLTGSKVGGRLDMDSLEVLQSLYMRDKAEFVTVTLRSAHIRGLVSLDGSKVTGTLDMDSLDVGQSLFMRDSPGLAEVVLRGAHVGQQLSLTGSKVTGTLNMNGLLVDQDLFMREKTELAEVDLTGAQIAAALALDGASVTGKLAMNRVRVGQSLYMGDGAKFAEVDLIGAHIGGQLDLSGSLSGSLPGAKVTGKLNMNSLEAQKSVLMNRRAEFAEIELISAHIGGQLNLAGSKVSGKLDMNAIQVGKDLLMYAESGDGADAVSGEFGEVDLTGGRVGGEISLTGVKIAGSLSMDSLQVGETLFMRKAKLARVSLRTARVGGDLSLSGASLTGDLDCFNIDVNSIVYLGGGADFAERIDLEFAKLGGLQLAGGVFHQDVNLTGTEIRGELFLGSRTQDPPRWPDGSGLLLRNAKADAIQDRVAIWDDMKSWPSRLDLTGFAYQHLGGSGAAERDVREKSRPDSTSKTGAKTDSGASATESQEMADRGPAWFKQWLGNQAHYSPQPYEQLATVLRAQGWPDTADSVLYASRDRERREASGWSRSAWLFVLKIVIGYGYQVWLALVWAILLLATGAAVQRTRPGADRHGWHRLVLYSFEMLLPVIRLRGQTREFTSGWQDFYFHFHSIMGFVLAAFLAAGLTGLTK